MNVRCPSCQTVFRVDPARVPAAGVRARCSRCGNGFHIDASGAIQGTGAAAPAPAPPVAAAPPVAPAPPPPATPAPPRPTFAPPAPAAPMPPAAQPAPVAATAAPAAPAPPPPAAPAAPAGQPRPSATVSAGTPVFGGSKDPNARAQRIARALVSDIVAYHKKKVEETLAAGTMRTEFRDEIMKSWEEYVAQVGQDMAKSTPHFRNALNEILARGQQVF